MARTDRIWASTTTPMLADQSGIPVSRATALPSLVQAREFPRDWQQVIGVTDVAGKKRLQRLPPVGVLVGSCRTGLQQSRKFRTSRCPPVPRSAKHRRCGSHTPERRAATFRSESPPRRARTVIGRARLGPLHGGRTVVTARPRRVVGRRRKAAGDAAVAYLIPKGGSRIRRAAGCRRWEGASL